MVLRPVLGSARVSRAGGRVLAIADFPKDDCFGETPETSTRDACATQSPESGFNQRCNCAFLHDFLPVRRAIYPGSFDPVTNGHLDVIERARTLFDEVIVAVAINDQKQPLFTPDERLAMLRQAITIDAVRVAPMEGLLVEFAASEGAHAVVRGLRAISDFEFEFQMALMNRKLDPEIETIFLMPKEEYTYLSSRIVKEIARLGGDVSAFVPSLVAEALAKKFNPELGNVAAVI